MAATIKSLLLKGNYVAVERGRLVITPISGKPVPDDWYRDYLHAFMVEIAATTEINIFQYQHFHVKEFKVKRSQGILSGGIMLNYVNIQTGESAQVFHNVALTKERKSKAGKKGDPLPKNQFRARKGGGFVKYWQRLGLKLPNRLSMFHRYMGNLKSVYVMAEVENHRLDKPTMQPASIGIDEMKMGFGMLAVVDNVQTTCRQDVDKAQTRSVDKETAKAQAQQGFQANSTTSNSSALLSNQVSTCKAMPLVNLSIGNTDTATKNYRDLPVWEPKTKQRNS